MQNYTLQKRIIIISFLIVPMLLLITFSYLPALNMVSYSFTEWKGYGNKTFVGLENYKALFTNPEYFSVFKVSLYYFFASFIQLGLALYFATILSFKVKGESFFKATLFFPYLINGVAIGFIFLYFYRPDGTLDMLLKTLGLGDTIKLWLGDPKVINYSLAGTSIWRYMGFNFIIFLGAIQSIPNEVYEAADMDGATSFNKFLYIILPSIAPIVQLNLILAVKGALSVFEIPFIMTGGGNGSKTFVIQTLNIAFKYNKVGLASAMAVVLLIISISVAVIQKKLMKGDE